MPMQPRPRAETSGPLRPRILFSTGTLLTCLRTRSAYGRKRLRTGRVQAHGMAEATRAVAGPSEGIGDDVEDDVVGPRGIAADAADPGEVIQRQGMAHSPGDVVVGAGGIAAGAEPPDDLLRRIVEAEAAAEDVHASDLDPDERVVGGSVVRRRALVRGFGVHGIAV